jgi:hypothetical protein
LAGKSSVRLKMVDFTAMYGDAFSVLDTTKPETVL